MARRRRKRSKRSKRKVLNFGVTPPRFWYGEITMLCPEIGQRVFKVPGPSAAAAVRNITNPRDHLPFFAKRCRVLSRRVVGANPP